MSLLDVFAGFCLVGILSAILAAPFVQKYRSAQVRLRYGGGDQAHPLTLNDQMERMHIKLIAFGRAFADPDPVARVYSRAESAYFNLWAVVYAVRELDHEARERVREADPLWVAVVIGAALMGAAVGIFAETVWWSVNLNT